ncbi:Protein transport protein sec22 [Verticillium dahliae VDG1]|nr:Protein transport protein sec22 [Verticillium dahliae VDG1]
MQRSPEWRTYPELRVEDLPPPNPAALRFPATVMTPAAAGAVFPALPIRPSMVDCHQKHRFINRSRQKKYAVACQTCHKADREDRWKCAACELRMCDGCFHFMNTNGRDLNKLADYLEAHPGDMAAPPTPHGPRPGTAMSQRA